MKSYTDINQSKKLAEILPFGSADMCYPLPCEEGDKPLLEEGGFGSTPCWSLSALLNVMPEEVHLVGSSIQSYWYCECVDSNVKSYLSKIADNPIDACVDMIVELKKQKLL